MLGHQTSIVDHVGLATMIVFTLQLLKRASWFPWLDQHTDLANRIISWALALVAAVGLKFSVDGTFDSGGVLTIVFPPFGTIVDGTLHFFGQGGLQESMYYMILKKAPEKYMAMAK